MAAGPFPREDGWPIAKIGMATTLRKTNPLQNVKPKLTLPRSFVRDIIPKG